MRQAGTVMGPAPAARGKRRFPAALPWASLAAAAGLLVGVGIGLLIMRSYRPATTSPPAPSGGQAAGQELADLEQKLAAAQGQTAELRGELDARKLEAAQEAEHYAANLKEAVASRQAHAGELDRAKNALKDAEDKAADTGKALASAAIDIERLRSELARLGEEFADETSRTQRRQHQVGEQVNALRQELAAVKARSDQQVENSRLLRLAAAAFVEGRLAASQAASRRSGMLDRLAELRARTPGGETAQLLDRLDMVLTQLELLEPDDPREAASLAGLLKHSGVRGRIDKALEIPDGEEAMRMWLLEVSLILAGAERAG